MTSVDVVDFYTKVESLGIKVWIDGGLGVDALLGKQTRPHSDLDIAIQQKDLPQGRELLELQGYREIRSDNAWKLFMGDGKGREIDFHIFIFNEIEHITEGIKYPTGALTGTGVIIGCMVKCISPEYMVQFHTGYKLRDSDFKDVVAPCDHFNIALLEEYTHFKKST